MTTHLLLMRAPPQLIFWLKYCLLTIAACQGISPNLTSPPPTILDVLEYTLPHSIEEEEIKRGRRGENKEEEEEKLEKNERKKKKKCTS